MSCAAKGHINRIFKHFGIKGYENYEPVTIDELESLINETPMKSIAEKESSPVTPFKANELELIEFQKLIHPYIFSRGFNKKTVLGNKIGFDKKSARITIPIFFCNKYYGCAKRTILKDVEPKIIYPEHLPKERILYTPLTQPETYDLILVVEGPLDALKGCQEGFFTAAIQGAEILPEHWNWLKSQNKTIILAMDNDKAGIGCIKKFIETNEFSEIINAVKIFNYANTDKKDICELTKKEIEYGIENAFSVIDWM